MNSRLNKNNAIETCILLLYLLFFISLSFSLRAVSSISIALLLIAGLIKHRGFPATILKQNKTNFLLAGCFLFFLLQFLSFFTDNDVQGAWKDIQLKSSIVFIPLAVLLSIPISQNKRNKIKAGYCILFAIASLYCLGVSLQHYLDNGNSSVFFYHSLTKPLHQHAVYFSIFVFVALVFLLDSLQKKQALFPVAISISLVLFLSFFLILLSSKLTISFYVIYLGWYILSQTRNPFFNKKIILGLCIFLFALVSILLITRNPVGNRFRDVVHGNLSIAKQDSFTHNDFLNGVQFRLLQWKLVPVILNDHNAWLAGVGATNAQPFLDQQYINRNMWPGIPEKGERGYPGFNTHNQLLESLLKNGVPGAIAFLLVLFAMLQLSWQKRHTSYFFVLLLLSAYACVESVLETQYGITLFVFFPFFLSTKE